MGNIDSPAKLKKMRREKYEFRGDINKVSGKYGKSMGYKLYSNKEDARKKYPPKNSSDQDIGQQGSYRDPLKVIYNHGETSEHSTNAHRYYGDYTMWNIIFLTPFFYKRMEYKNAKCSRKRETKSGIIYRRKWTYNRQNHSCQSK